MPATEPVAGRSVEEVVAALNRTLTSRRLAELLASVAELSAAEAEVVLRATRVKLNRGSVPRDAGRAVLLAAVARVAELDGARAVALLPGLRAMRDEAADSIVAAVAGVDPGRAAALLTGEVRDSLGEQKTERLAARLSAAWAEKNYDEALVWAESQSGKLRDHALAGMVGTMFERDAEKATELARMLPAGEASTLACTEVLMEWSRRDPARALELMSGGLLPKQEDASALIFADWAQRDVEASRLAAQGLDGRAGEVAVAEVAEVWGQRDPEAAAQWLADQSKGATNVNAWMSLSHTWGASDPQAASEWVLSMPAGAGRDGAVMGLVDSQRERDAASAVAWAETISDGRMRERALMGAYNRWKAKEPAPAAAWLESTSALTTGQKAALKSQ